MALKSTHMNNIKQDHRKVYKFHIYQTHCSLTLFIVMTSEQYIASAKQGLINARSYLQTPNWRNGVSAVRTCISYVDASQIMFNNSRLEERLWILNEVQQFAYHDLDAGGVKDLATWCEVEYNRILSTNPSHIGALRGKFESSLDSIMWGMNSNKRNSTRPSMAMEIPVLVGEGLP